MAIERFVSRRELGWGSTSSGWAMTNQGMIAHYDSGYWLRNRRRELKAANRSEHIACGEYWTRTRNMHRAGNGWRDVGYAYFVCPDDYVFAGREVNHVQAAEAPTPGKMQNGNTRYVAVTFGLGPDEVPTDGALRAWARLRKWLMDTHGVRGNVYGHRDFTSTSCPGDEIYKLVRSGKLKGSAAPVPPAPAKPPAQEEEVFDYASFGASDVGKTELQPEVWTDVLFDTEYDDPTGAHPDKGSNPSLLKGKPTLYTLEFGADIEGGTVGDTFDIDCAEYVYNNKVRPAVDELKETGKSTSMALTGTFRIHHSAVGNLRKDGKLRVRVRSHSPVPVKIAGARVSVLFAS